MSVCNSSPATVLKTRTGHLTLRVSGENGASKTLHSLYDPEAEARALVEAFRFDGDGVLVVLGLGLGYHLHYLAARFPRAEIVVVEAQREIYDLWKRYGEHPASEGKVDFLVAWRPEEAIREITRRQLRAGMPPLGLFSLAPAVSFFPDYYQPIVSRLGRAAKVRLWDKLKYEKFTEEAVRVALIDFGYFLTREIESALCRLGQKVHRVPVRKGEDGHRITSRMIEEIVSFRPDFFLTINHLGFDEEGILASFFQSIEMPVGSWFVDSPNLIVKAFRENVSPYVTLFLWDKGYVSDMEALGFESVCYLPLATDETLFKPLGRNGKKGRVRPCEVGFVGNSMVEPTAKWMARLPLSLHPLVEALAEECLRRRTSFDDLVKTRREEDRLRIDALEPAGRADLEAAVLWKTTQRYRLQCVRTLTPFDLKVHGDKGWKTLLDRPAALSPPIDYYRELPGFYNQCAISFNATNLQMGAAVNQRVFDVPACGAFLLTDHQEALCEAFEPGREVVVFQDVSEIPDLIRHYLKHPAERKAIGERGRQRVLQEHTYRHRLEQIIARMRSRYRSGP